MPAAVATIEPTVIPAGDTVSWTKSLNDYPASDGWALSYAFRGEKGGGRLDVTGIGSGQTYTLTIPGASSNVMNAGIWRWDAYVTLAGVRTRIGSGSTRVDPNLAVTNFAQDIRTPVKIAYDNAMEAWQTFARAKTVTLNGRVYTARDTEDLKLYVDTCKSDWAFEQQQIAVAAGTATGGDPRKVWGAFRPRE